MDAFEKVRSAASTMAQAIGWGKAAHAGYEDGERLLQLEKYAEAEEALLKAVAEIQAEAAPRNWRARVHLALAKSQWKLKKFDEARQNAESAHEMLSRKRRPTGDLADCLDLRASIQEASGDTDGAIRLFREALEAQRKVFPVQHLTLTNRYRRLAAALAAGEPAEATTLFKKALEVAEKRLGTQSPAAADCLMDLGRHELLRGEKEAGIAFMERAKEIHRDTHGETSDEVARAMQFMALSCRDAGELEKSIFYYEQALHVRERQVGGSSLDFANLLVGFAEAQTLVGNEAPATELLQQAVGKLTRSGGEPLAQTLESLAEVYGGLGRFSDAVSCLKQARGIWEKDPGVYTEALQFNGAMLQHAQQYAPTEGGAPAGTFRLDLRTGSRLSEPHQPVVFGEGLRGWPAPRALQPQPSQPDWPPPGQRPYASPSQASRSTPPAPSRDEPAAPVIPVILVQPGAPPPGTLAAPARPARSAPAPAVPESLPTQAPAAASPLPGAAMQPLAANEARAATPPVFGAGAPQPPFGAGAPQPAPGASTTEQAPPDQVPVHLVVGLPPAAQAPAGAAAANHVPHAPAQASPPAPPLMVPIEARAPQAPPTQDNGGGKLHVSFVGSSGAPVPTMPASAAPSPLHLTVVVPDGGLPMDAMLTPVELAPADLNVRAMSGWEELGFDFLQAS